MKTILAEHFGVRIEQDEIEALLDTLDKSFLLENDRMSEAQERVLEEFKQAPFRQPTLAGISYPSDPVELKLTLDKYTEKVGPLEKASNEIRGLISPHIDFERGWRVYAETWGRAVDAIREADLFVIFGTDHFGPDGDITLTYQNYATPKDVLPTSRDAVDRLKDAIGEEKVFNGELHHRSEHSIELAAVWLNHIRDGEACELLPILCGSFAPFIRGENDLVAATELSIAVETLREIASNRRIFVIAAADLAHFGPAFGGAPVDLSEHARIHAADRDLMAHICGGDASGFLNAILNVEDQFNVCGTAPIYLTLQTLEPTSGEIVAYEHCPADHTDTSTVSICGVLFE